VLGPFENVPRLSLRYGRCHDLETGFLFLPQLVCLQSAKPAM
jgi:hypothetical protein